MSKTYVFPGQGSQTVGMGAELFDKYPELVTEADEILGYSVRTLCLEDPDEVINLTQYTQPALFVVEALEYLEKGDDKPDYLAGHSLGEYAALFAAGAYDFATGIKLVQKRGELMGKAKGGGMAAVIGLDATAVRTALDSSGVSSIDVANYNSPGQIIISGPIEDFEGVQEAFKAAGARRVIPLKVSAAFHSRYMEEAKVEFSSYLESVSFSTLLVPVIANVTAAPYENDKIRENLANQITSSVRWQESIEYLLNLANDMEFEELGPGNVLEKMIKQIADARA